MMSEILPRNARKKRARVSPDSLAPPFGFVQKLGICTLFVAIASALVATRAEFRRQLKTRQSPQYLYGKDVKLYIAVKLPANDEKWIGIEKALFLTSRVFRGKVVAQSVGHEGDAGYVTLLWRSPRTRKNSRAETIRFSETGDVKRVAKHVWQTLKERLVFITDEDPIRLLGKRFLMTCSQIDHHESDSPNPLQ